MGGKNTAAIKVVDCREEAIPGHKPKFRRNCIEEDRLVEAGVIPLAWVKQGYLGMCDAHKQKIFRFTVKEKARWDLTTGGEAHTGHTIRKMVEAGLNPKKYLG